VAEHEREAISERTKAALAAAKARGTRLGNAIAGQLDARKVATARGGRWTHVQVGQLLNRASSRAEMTKGRDDALKALLPPVGSPYSFYNLSEAETKALEEALGDGFGQRSALGSKQLPLPQKTESGQKIESGLLKISYFELDTSNGAATEKYEDGEHPIWYPGPVDQPAPFVFPPLGFNTRKLRIYFDNQLDRFERVARPCSCQTRQQLAMHRLFEKP
jgi:hypothetical protein